MKEAYQLAALRLEPPHKLLEGCAELCMERHVWPQRLSGAACGRQNTSLV